MLHMDQQDELFQVIMTKKLLSSVREIRTLLNAWYLMSILQEAWY